MNKIRDKWYAPINLILLLGVVAVIAGLRFAWLAYNNFTDYNGEPNFRSPEFIEKLTSVINGSSGVCFTLAGVIFLGYTLYQTRVEMSDTRKILGTQLAESTFFKLMEHHRALVDNKNNLKTEAPNELTDEEDEVELHTLKDEIQIITNRLLEYQSCIDNRAFTSFEQTQYLPLLQYVHFEKVKLIGGSLIHIVNFISKKLTTEQDFYHSTLNFNITDDEKWLIGFILKYKLETIGEVKYDFSAHYNGTLLNHRLLIRPDQFPALFVEPYYSSELYLPDLTEKTIKLFETEISNFTEIVFYRDSLKDLKITSILANELEERPKSRPPFIEVAFKIEKDRYGRDKVTVFSLFENIITKKLNTQKYVDMELTFYFEHKGETYIVSHAPFRVQKYLIKIPNNKYVQQLATEIAKRFNIDEVHSILIQDYKEVIHSDQFNEENF